MKSKQTLKFLGYYLTPFVLSCFGVFVTWHTASFVVMAVAIVCNAVWAWFTPNRHSFPTALLVAGSWLYAWVLLYFSVSVWSLLFFCYVGVGVTLFSFIFSLMVGSNLLRFCNEKRGNLWQVTTTAKGVKILACILLVPLCTAIVVSCIYGHNEAVYKPQEVWVSYSE